jgi:hypothetical protein
MMNSKLPQAFGLMKTKLVWDGSRSSLLHVDVAVHGSWAYGCVVVGEEDGQSVGIGKLEAVFFGL